IISNNHIYDNTTGIRFTSGGTGSVSASNFDGGVAADNGTDVAIGNTGVTIGANNAFAGDTYFINNQSIQSYDLSANGTTFDQASNFRIEDRMFHKVDFGNTSAGLITWVANNVYVTAPSTASPGSSDTDSDIQRGIDAAPSNYTVAIEAGSYT